jgi:hypothetical protein
MPYSVNNIKISFCPWPGIYSRYHKITRMSVPLVMQWLIGTWFIISSDAPIWLKGNKESPTLNYTLQEKKSDYRMLDETKYSQKGKHKTIAGYDHSAPGKPKGFVWRGKGALFFVKSKWEVRLQDPAGEWAVIYYSKTLFTPKGADILSRKPTLMRSGHS